MFVDTSPIHITSNLLGQTVLGSLLENNHAPWKVALIYFGGGILGALSSSFLEKSASLVGASAALFALGFSCVAEMQIVSDRMMCVKGEMCDDILRATTEVQGTGKCGCWACCICCWWTRGESSWTTLLGPRLQCTALEPLEVTS